MALVFKEAKVIIKGSLLLKLVAVIILFLIVGIFLFFNFIMSQMTQTLGPAQTQNDILPTIFPLLMGFNALVFLIVLYFALPMFFSTFQAIKESNTQWRFIRPKFFLGIPIGSESITQTSTLQKIKLKHLVWIAGPIVINVPVFIFENSKEIGVRENFEKSLSTTLAPFGISKEELKDLCDKFNVLNESDI